MKILVLGTLLFLGCGPTAPDTSFERFQDMQTSYLEKDKEGNVLSSSWWTFSYGQVYGADLKKIENAPGYMPVKHHRGTYTIYGDTMRWLFQDNVTFNFKRDTIWDSSNTQCITKSWETREFHWTYQTMQDMQIWGWYPIGASLPPYTTRCYPYMVDVFVWDRNPNNYNTTYGASWYVEFKILSWTEQEILFLRLADLEDTLRFTAYDTPRTNPGHRAYQEIATPMAQNIFTPEDL